MRKHLPNILLLIIILANMVFLGLFISSYGLGVFLTTTGTVFLVLGIIIFIFFLSIDPGYGWIRSIEFTKNYIFIFSSMAVCMAGVVLIVIGSHVHELQERAFNQVMRCQDLLTGNVAKVLEEDWYSLRDQQRHAAVSVYLFQKKSNRNDYKIIAVMKNCNSGQSIKDLVISSESIPHPMTVSEKKSSCPGVVEKDISIKFGRNRGMEQQVQFDLLVRVDEEAVPGDCVTEKEQIVHCNLISGISENM